ncbi:hypothetical protein Q75_13315 [Bacillus coahuilensis p1.1.43]|uniref:Chemotaxis protein n=2 Tax=Bacillus coahuilensis TaxID=408580 RepID=A0A147K637_9BACI|nr:methyl-accepting chemotaxis protein [Bacillus coahuilensis]KUP05228.1 hypothetical protein Q75_13315 [Bacillus coahuilensis p1.1.43]
MKLRRNPFQVSSKSLLVKMLSSILSIVLVSLLVLSTISIYVSYSIISSDSKTWLETELGETMDGIEKEFIGHQRIAESISQIVGVNGTDMSTSQYQNLLERMAVINESTLGTGVWFEPYAYQSETQYFGPYVYKDGNSTTFTEEYATADYDYPNQDWYVNGKGAMNWSTPYFDEATGITMITTAAPITNDRNEFIGVVSADIDLSTVQEQINNVQIKESGYAILFDQTGTVLAHPDTEKIMNSTIEEDPILSSLARMMTQPSGSSTIDSSEGKLTVQYATVPQTGWTLGIIVPQAELFASLYGLAWKVLLATIVALLAITVFVFFFTRSHTRKIIELNLAMERVATGDLTVHVPVKSTDEIGSLGLRLNETVGTIKSMVSSISDSAHALAATSAQLNVSSEETNRAIQEVATSIQRTAQITDDEVQHISVLKDVADRVVHLIQIISEQTKDLQKSALEAKVLAEEGNDSITSFVHNMKEIEDTSEKVSSRVKSLSSASKEIEGMVNLIDEIAEQTNLLALNASIEAARAGDHGKGFAVVAEEVRKLATESSSTSSTIKKLIREVQVHIEGVVAQMIVNMNAVKSGKVQVELSGENFTRISETIQRVATSSDETTKEIQSIEDHIAHLQKVVGEIHVLIEESNEFAQNVSAATEEQSAAVDEITSTSESLSERAGELEGEIQRFKLK